MSTLKAAVVGTGFIGPVHAEALKQIGVQVRGILGSSPAKVGLPLMLCIWMWPMTVMPFNSGCGGGIRYTSLRQTKIIWI